MSQGKDWTGFVMESEGVELVDDGIERFREEHEMVAVFIVKIRREIYQHRV
jgi:hypothetical protein